MQSKLKVNPSESASTTSSEILENSQEYWDKVLTQAGLSMNRGNPPRIWVNRGEPDEHRENRTTYVGTSANLVGIEEEQERVRTGRVKPKGSRPE